MKIVQNRDWFIIQKFNWKKLRYKTIMLKDIDQNTDLLERILFFKSYKAAQEFLDYYQYYRDISAYYFEIYNF